MNLGQDFLDFPTAWAIQDAGLDHLDPRCSAVQTDCFLCDCGAVEKRWEELRAARVDANTSDVVQ